MQTQTRSKVRTPEQQARDALVRALSFVESKLERKRLELAPLEDQATRLQGAIDVLDGGPSENGMT